MINVFEDCNFIEEEFRLLDVFLGYFFDSPPFPLDTLFPGLVDDPIGPFAKFLRWWMVYFGTELVILEDVVLSALYEELLVDMELIFLHDDYLNNYKQGINYKKGSSKPLS